MASFVTNERPKLSYSATLPSCNNNNLYGRSVLLVGPNRWTQPLAAALLKVQFDGPVQSTAVATGTPTTTPTTAIDPAVEALRRHVFHCPPKRVIHTVESLEDPRWSFRMDHIVILSAASTNSTIPSGQSGDDAYHHRSTNRLLHEDYTLYQRSTKVHVHEIGGPMNRRTIRMQERGEEETTLIQTLNLYLESPSSLATVARMILQRTKVGTREGTSVLPHVSPMIFGTYLT